MFQYFREQQRDLTMKSRNQETGPFSQSLTLSQATLVQNPGQLGIKLDIKRRGIASLVVPRNKLAQTLTQARSSDRHSRAPLMTEGRTEPIVPLPGNHCQTFGLTLVRRFSRHLTRVHNGRVRSLGRQVKTSIVATGWRTISPRLIKPQL